MLAAGDRGVMVNSTQKNRSFSIRLGYAINGLVQALKSEHSLRTQLAVFAAVLAALIVLHPAPFWWALVLFASCAVMAAELFNTAIERLADHLHPEQHPEIRIVKDCAAAAVLLVVVGALTVAAAYLIERLHWL
jgi:undecaprenol kinase